MLARAGAATGRGEPVVLLDGNFPSVAHRRELLGPAAAAGCRLVLVHVAIDAETARVRARQRATDPHRTSDADEAVTGALHARFEPPGDEIPWRIDVDGGTPTAALLHLTLQSLLSLPMTPAPGH